MIRLSAILGVCGVLAACAQTAPNTQAALGESIYRSAFQNESFVPGDVRIVAASGREMRTYALRACGNTVCGARRGALRYEGDTAVVTRAYRGGTFYLAPGGGGMLEVGRSQTPLAWDIAD